ncbi:MAG TPA: hypothetical protein VK541_22310 [Pedobacter sp.]|uniref:hypothetical protein n=1 Tax=Pedobacter sp. TaxID=1411316 RepID=UPI002CC85EEB|nr:hypothetical protein [Pedobacter sp.]HMI05238.1 hypothetical protein [Pedobacter sp.]
MKTIATLVPALILIGYAVAGCKLLKIKGYTGGWYALILISATPLFWFIFGAVKAKSPNPITKLWSNIAIGIGIFTLMLIVWMKQ